MGISPNKAYLNSLYTIGFLKLLLQRLLYKGIVSAHNVYIKSKMTKNYLIHLILLWAWLRPIQKEGT